MIVGQMEIQLMANIARLQRDMDAARQVVGNATAGMERAANAAKAALASIGAGVGVQQMAGMVDEYTKFTSQLKLATQSQREYALAYADVQRISTQSTQGLQETGVLYARIANGTRELGVAQQRVAAITETVNLSLLVSGATASEAASAQMQLSQAFAAGRLNGEEFNAVNEAAPRLMLALADGIGVPVGALKKMAEEGQLTSQVMSTVLPNALSKLREEAKEIQTISGAFTVLRNEVMEFVGTQAQANGVVAATSGALTMLAENLGFVAGAVGVIAGGRLVAWLSNAAGGALNAAAANRAFLTSNLEVVRSEATATAQASLLANARTAEIRAATVAAQGNVQLALTYNGLIPAQNRAAAAAAVHEASMSRLAVAQRAAAVSTAALAAGTRVLNGALALTGGPLGMIIMTLGIAALAWTHYGDKAKEAAEKAKGETEKSTQEITDGLIKQNEKLQERIELAKRAGMQGAAQQGGEGVERLASLGAQINKMLDDINSGFRPEEDRLRVVELQYEYTMLANAIDKLNASQQTLSAGSTADKMKQWFGQNGSDAQKLDYELEQLRVQFGGQLPAAIEQFVRARAADKGMKEQVKAAKEYAELLDRINGTNAGLDPDFKENMSALHAGYKAGKQSLEDYTATVQKYLSQQPYAKQAEDDRLKFQEDYAQGLDATSSVYAKMVKDAEEEAARNEELASTYGMTKLAVEQLELARLEGQLAQRATLGLTLKEIETLEKLIAAKKRNTAAIGAMEQVDVAKKAQEEWKRAAESIEQSLTDALLRGFESGKGFGENLADTLKNMFSTLVLRPVVSAVVNPMAGAVTGALGLSGPAGAATSAAASGLGSAVGTGLGIGGAMSAIGTGAVQTAGALLTGQIGFGTTLSAGLSAIGTGTMSGISAGLSSVVGVLGPIALGLGAAVAIWKKMDSSGTYHTGGAAMSSSSGTSTVSAQSLNMANIRSSADTQKFVEGLTQGIVGILDSTALAFGKTAGYTAATAFADDSSKDGAWGSLVIQKLGQDIIDWQDTRNGRKWAPKTFADGEKGQAEYLAALTGSVRDALNSIGLPDWARTMLNGVASDASLENLAQVVEQINVTQAALAAMRSQLVGFKDLSDTTVSALMAASGGIDKLFGNASAYYDAFYTEAEKNAVVSQQVAKALAAVNLQMPTTREGYRALLEAQMKLGPAGAEAVAVLFGAAAAFAQITPVVEAVKEAAKDLTPYRNALTEAYNAESDAIQGTVNRMGSFAASLRELGKSALLGSLSPLSPQQKYVEAKAQYEAVLAAARGGDESAQGRYSEVYTAFLEASRSLFASSGQYTRDFDYAQAATAEAARWAEQQVDVGKSQLTLLKSQVSGLIDVNTSVLSVREAILQLLQAEGKAPVGPQMPAPAFYVSPAVYGAPNTEPLVAEIKALRQEVSTLRAEQARQTGDMIRANAQASKESAADIAGATTTAVKSAAYREERVYPE